MSRMMKAYAKVRPEPGAMEVIEVPRPDSPGPDEVTIRITSVGICGTDLSIYKWTETVAREYHPVFPLIIGHEFAGVVEQAGSEVLLLKPGDKVAVNPHISCGKCEYCLAGRENVCQVRPILGCHANGGLTQYINVRSSNVFRLPDTVPEHIGCLAEPLSVTVHAYERVHRRGDRAAVIIGAGTIGLLQYLVCKATGYEQIVLFGLESDKERLALAASLGAQTVNIEKEDPASALKRFLGRPCADVVYEVAGTHDSINLSVELVKPTGRVALVGIASSATPLDTTKLVFAEKELIGVRAYTLSTWPKTMEIMGVISKDLESIVTHRLTLDETDQAFELIKNRKCLKAVVEPNK